MPAANPTYDEVVVRLAALEKQMTDGNMPLDALPMQELSDRLANITIPEGDLSLLPHSTGPDSLSVVPAATLTRRTAFATVPGAHNCIPFTNIEFQQEVQIDITLQPTRITIVRPGIYLMISFLGIVAGPGYTSHSILISGNSAVSDEEARVAGAATLTSISHIQRLSAGQYVEASYYTDIASAFYLGGGGAGGCVTGADDRVPKLSVIYLSFVEGF